MAGRSQVTIRELRDDLLRLSEVVQRAVPTVEEFDEFVEVGLKAVEPLAAVLPSETPSRRQTATNQARIIVTQAADLARGWDMELVILGLHELMAGIQAVHHETRIGQTLAVNDLHEVTRDFIDSYKVFKEHLSLDAAFLLVQHADRLTGAFSHLRELVDGLLEQLGDPGQVGEDQGALDVYLPVTPSFQSVMEVLSAFSELYASIAVVVGDDPDARPLVLRRIDVGTLWFVAVGARATMSAMRALFRSVCSSLTRRGRAETLTAEIEAAMRLSDFAEIVRETGGDDGPLLERLHAAVPGLAEKFARLMPALGGTVEVDGEPFAVEGDITTQLPAPRKALPAPREYRRHLGGKVWHFCPTCSNWPTADYESSPQLPDGERADSECLSKQRRGRCR